MIKWLKDTKFKLERFLFVNKRGLQMGLEHGQSGGPQLTEMQFAALLALDWLTHLEKTGRAHLMTTKEVDIMRRVRAQRAEERHVLGRILSTINKTSYQNRMLN